MSSPLCTLVVVKSTDLVQVDRFFPLFLETSMLRWACTHCICNKFHPHERHYLRVVQPSRVVQPWLFAFYAAALALIADDQDKGKKPAKSLWLFSFNNNTCNLCSFFNKKDNLELKALLEYQIANALTLKICGALAPWNHEKPCNYGLGRVLVLKRIGYGWSLT